MTRQRDYLEETLEKERNERKSSENEKNELKKECMRLKAAIENIEKDKLNDMEKTNDLIGKLSNASQKLDDAYSKISDLENQRALLNKEIKDKDFQMNEAVKNKDEMKKKYTKAKKTIRSHIEAQEKLAKENEGLIERLKRLSSEYSEELNQIKEIPPKQDIRIIELERELSEVNNRNKDQARIIDENEVEIESMTNTINELKKKLTEVVNENESLQEESRKEKTLCSKYQEDIKGLHKEFHSIKVGVKKQNETLISEKYKTEDLNQQQNRVINELQSEKESLTKKVKELENELRSTKDHLNQLKTINQDLENRNHKLICTISKCSSSHLYTPLKGSENEATPKNKLPPQNLVVNYTSPFGNSLENSKEYLNIEFEHRSAPRRMAKITEVDISGFEERLKKTITTLGTYKNINNC